MKWFQVFLCTINNSIKCQSFVHTQLNDQTVLFLTIQFSICYLFAHNLNVKQMGPNLVLPLQVRVDLGEMVMKGYSAFPKTPVLLEPHHQIFIYVSYPRHLLGCARGVMVIVVGSGHGDMSSNPGRG